MTINRQQEIMSRMGLVRGKEYIAAIFKTFNEMLERWHREQVDRDWNRRVAIITRQP